MQVANTHLTGRGCPQCGREFVTNNNKYNPSGWSTKNWENKAKTSKNFDSFKVYIIKCWNENELFYKVGRTFKTVRQRFKDAKSMPYNYEIIDELVFDNAIDCWNKESELKRLNNENKYLPLIHFNGENECFKQIK